MFGKSLLFILLGYVYTQVGIVKADVNLDCTNNGRPLNPFPGDCNKFYECTNQGVEIHDCPAGLHFNPVYLVCDYPENAGCTEGVPPPAPETPEPEVLTTLEPEPDRTTVDNSKTTPAEETEQFDCPIDADLSFRPHPTNCNQFYQCYGGESHIFTCQEGLHFNPAEQVCDYPENVGCVGGTAPPPNVTTTTTTTTTTTSQPTEEFDCPIDADLSFRPHPTNCNQFYQCYGGESHIFTCQEGLHFNPAEQVCDYPENVGCVGGTAPPPNVTTTTTTTTTTTSQPTEEFDCPIDADLSFRPHPTNCNQFYQCYGGESHVFTCQEGLHFNPAEQVCDYPENVGCIGGTAPPSNVTTTTTTTTTTSQPTEEFNCPIDADLSYRPHPTNCNQFYQCYGGSAYIFTCQEGLQFNPAAQACDYPENVGCVGGTVTTTISTSTVSPTVSNPNPEPNECRMDSDQLYHQVLENCNQFYQCYDGYKYIFNCQVGLQFNYPAQACDYPENVVCANV